MTVLEASSQLFEWFRENDTFEMGEHFQRVVLVSDQPNKDKAAFTCALEDLEKMEMIQSCKLDEKEYWTLRKGFEAYEQTVTINPTVAIMISTVVNGYCDIISLQEEKCDPANIAEKDIRNLLFICNQQLDEK
tara:strand:- start:81 stop:479 length:399 start_codon:yes stop_codon:yes gene_type:complete